jgi:flagellar biogenesis protein FliO
VGVLVGLSLVAAALLLALRAWAGRPSVTAGMRVLGRLALEPRRSIYLVEIGGRCFVVGVGDGPMAMLGEVEAPPAPLVAGQAEVEPAVLLRAWRRVVGGRV